MRVVTRDADIFDHLTGDSDPPHKDRDEGELDDHEWAKSLDQLVVEIARTTLATASLLEIKVAEINAAIARLENTDAALGSEIGNAVTAVSGNAAAIKDVVAQAQAAVDKAEHIGKSVQEQADDARAATDMMLRERSDDMASSVGASAERLQGVYGSAARTLEEAAGRHQQFIDRYQELAAALERATTSTGAIVGQAMARAETETARRHTETTSLVSAKAEETQRRLKAFEEKIGTQAVQTGAAIQTGSHHIGDLVTRSHTSLRQEVVEAKGKLDQRLGVLADWQAKKVDLLSEKVGLLETGLKQQGQRAEAKTTARVDKLESTLVNAVGMISANHERAQGIQTWWNVAITALLIAVAFRRHVSWLVIALALGIAVCVVQAVRMREKTRSESAR